MQKKLNNPCPIGSAVAVFDYICDEFGKRIITAQQEAVWHGSTEREIDHIFEITDKFPAMRGFDFISDSYLSVAERALDWWEKGGLVTICWHTGINGKGYQESKEDKPDFDKLLTAGTKEQDEMLKVWDKAAYALLWLRDRGVPVLWRPFHEFDGMWFWWGKGGKDNFIKLWRMMYDRYTDKFGLNNLIWVLGYSGEVRDGWYPGDEYCDIIGSDTYETPINKSGWERLLRVSSDNKPMAFHENGSLPVPFEAFKESGCMWSWFMLWHTRFVFELDHDMIRKAYNSELSITHDMLPDFGYGFGKRRKALYKRIFLNQSGYFPKDVKKASLPFPAERFTVEDMAGNEVLSGECTHFGSDRASGDDVYIADLSKLETPGRYIVKARGRISDSFEISPCVYDGLYRDIMRAYYYLRCGTELKAENALEFTHAACHTGIAKEWFDHSVEKEVTGGWHDAGDYGRYVTPGAVAVAHLLYSHILFPSATDNVDLNIPKGENGMPDHLTECKYELDWLMKMQKSDGGVYHKLTTALHAPFVMPEEDNEQLYLLPVSSMATADLAAVCAIASRVYSKYDKDYSEKLLEASKKSAEWLDNNPQFIGFMNPEGCGTGGYGEGGDKDNRFWAYCELYSATGDDKYHEKLKSLLVYDFSRTELGVGSVGGLGALSYITCERETKDENMSNAFKEMFASRAGMLSWIASRSGYGCAMDERSFVWGSNMGLMKNAMICAIVDTVCGDERAYQTAKSQLDVLMGNNPLGVSYVTGNGDSAYNNPHLRPAFADGIERSIPGMVSGGPNSHPAEREARRFIPEGTPPMKCYVDRMEFYSINEITIYWNSPAAFVLAYILDKNSK